MIQGSSVSVRTTARPRNVWCKQQGRGEAAEDCSETEPNTQKNEFQSDSQKTSS